ncbi:MAG: hypothetical protein P8Y97_15760 [Candidatus Lokiarchaeota archaeon]
MGNTVIIVEHDKRFIEIADEILDIGPGAGLYGGEILYQGDLEGIKNQMNSLTSQFLNRKLKFPEKIKKIEVCEKTKYITLKNVATNNLKNVYVDIPLGMLVGVAGVSGSGKSSLILDTLVPLLRPYFKRGYENITESKSNNNINNDEEDDETLYEFSGIVEGWDNIDEIIVVDQKPIGRTRRSTPVTYIKRPFFL